MLRNNIMLMWGILAIAIVFVVYRANNMKPLAVLIIPGFIHSMAVRNRVQNHPKKKANGLGSRKPTYGSHGETQTGRKY